MTLRYSLGMLLFEIRLIISTYIFYLLSDYTGLIESLGKFLSLELMKYVTNLNVQMTDFFISFPTGIMVINELSILSPPNLLWKTDKMIHVDSIICKFDLVSLLYWGILSYGNTIRVISIKINGLTFWIEGWEDPSTGEQILNTDLIGATNLEKLNSKNIVEFKKENITSYRNLISDLKIKVHDITCGHPNQKAIIQRHSIISKSIVQLQKIVNDGINQVATECVGIARDGLISTAKKKISQLYKTAKRKVGKTLLQKLEDLHESMTGPEPVATAGDPRIYGQSLEFQDIIVHIRNVLPPALRHLEYSRPFFISKFSIPLNEDDDRIIIPDSGAIHVEPCMTLQNQTNLHDSNNDTIASKNDFMHQKSLAIPSVSDNKYISTTHSSRVRTIVWKKYVNQKRWEMMTQRLKTIRNLPTDGSDENRIDSEISWVDNRVCFDDLILDPQWGDEYSEGEDDDLIAETWRDVANGESTVTPTKPLTSSRNDRAKYLMSMAVTFDETERVQLKFGLCKGISIRILDYRFQKTLLVQLLKSNAGRIIYDSLLEWTGFFNGGGKDRGDFNEDFEDDEYVTETNPIFFDPSQL